MDKVLLELSFFERILYKTTVVKRSRVLMKVSGSNVSVYTSDPTLHPFS